MSTHSILRFANEECGSLEFVADCKKTPTEQCTSTDVDWLKIWKLLLFSDDEIKWFKQAYPCEEIKDTEGEQYKAAMEVAKTIHKNLKPRSMDH